MAGPCESNGADREGANGWIREQPVSDGYSIAVDGVDLPDKAVYGRKGAIGERKKGEIGILARRSGDVVGLHTITYGTIGEEIELTHRATSRDTFVLGALRAAKFAASKESGLFSMGEVLGL